MSTSFKNIFSVVALHSDRPVSESNIEHFSGHRALLIFILPVQLGAILHLTHQVNVTANNILMGSSILMSCQVYREKKSPLENNPPHGKLQPQKWNQQL